MNPYLLVVTVIFIVLKNIHRRVEWERTIMFNDKKKPKQNKQKKKDHLGFFPFHCRIVGYLEIGY